MLRRVLALHITGLATVVLESVTDEGVPQLRICPIPLDPIYPPHNVGSDTSTQYRWIRYFLSVNTTGSDISHGQHRWIRYTYPITVGSDTPTQYRWIRNNLSTLFIRHCSGLKAVVSNLEIGCWSSSSQEGRREAHKNQIAWV